MKNLNRGEILFLLLVLGIIGLYLSYDATKQLNQEFKNVILIGWDGAQRDHMYELLSDGKLPNLERLIDEGIIVDIKISDGKTDTKAGWAQILTGYDVKITGVYTNREYGPIPEGYTIFERLENHFGDENIVTILLAGKYQNLGTRGPHKICLNCERVYWWNENLSQPKKLGDEKVLVSRKGEPYFFSHKNIDVFKNGLLDPYNYNESAAVETNVGMELLRQIEERKDQRFFIFAQFEEPDEQGHFYGENSEQYTQGIILDDYWLGETVNKLKEYGIYNETLIYVVADHGFDEGKRKHKHAPYVFLATNDKLVKKNGDRRDITPTILERYALDLNKINPPLNGSSLLTN